MTLFWRMLETLLKPIAHKGPNTVICGAEDLYGLPRFLNLRQKCSENTTLHPPSRPVSKLQGISGSFEL
jgi:hypothetical protein